MREPGGGAPLCIATIARDSTERLRAERSERQLELARRFQAQAVQLNDDVVQGLIVAKLALEHGDADLADAAVERTLESARAIVADLLESAMPAEGYAPGDLVRTRPADGS